MRDTHSGAFASDAIRSSWQRCERAYKLSRDAGRPILRLQSSEVAPRLEALIDRIGGRHGIFQHLARLAKEAALEAARQQKRQEEARASSRILGWVTGAKPSSS